LATRYHLFHHPQQMVKLGMLGVGMLRRNRMALRPKSIEGLDQLQAILNKAKSIASEERQS